MNTTKTIVLMVGLTVLLVFIGGALGGRQGMILAFLFAFGMILASYLRGEPNGGAYNAGQPRTLQSGPRQLHAQ